jgi:hypothetical protein
VKPVDVDTCFLFTFYCATSLVFDAKLSSGRVAPKLEYSSPNVFLPDVINA